MASLTTTLGAEFTPAVGKFIVVASAPCVLLRRNSVAHAAGFRSVPGCPFVGSVDVEQAVAGAVWKVVAAASGTTPLIGVDQ